jgi:3-hydroxyisobutyrate dehydrogenase-like beta-hydroxyacid dehydrogenase
MTKLQKNNVAVIGLGQMGSGIAKNIDNAGFLRAVVDNNKNAISTYDSRKNILVNNNIDMCNSCDVLIFVVPSTKQISEIIFDQGGIISNLKEGTVIVDLTTSDPKESSILSKKCEEHKISYLDCGMTGGATGADNGTLTLMIGGKIEELNEVSPILESFTNKLFHVGK